MTKRKSSQAQITEDYLLPDLDQNVAFLKSAFNNSSDCVFREFVIGDKIKAFIICIDGLVSKTTLHEDVLKPLMFSFAASELPKREINTYIKEKLITASDLKEVETFFEITTAVLSGDAALLVEKQPKAIIISLRGYEMRSVSEPHIESIVRGPREGFNESLRVNTSLIRRKIKNPDLVFESLTVGKRTRTDLNIVYVKNLVKEDILNEVRKRIQAIDIDEVLDSGYIEQLIEDNPLSPFATIGYTEKPDVAAAKILEGRVVVIVDGSPTVLTIPLLFIEHFQTAEDYYSRPFYMSFVRLLRYLAFIASIISPAYYIVLASYHQELLQTPLLVSIAAPAEGTPFPAILEVAIMGFFFEVLREAGVRMPRPVGQAVSIVGALVIGEASVSAGLVGEPLVIVIAVTAITSFVVPSLNDVGTLLRIYFFVLVSFFGVVGVGVGTLVLLIHLASLRSFGVPFLAPISPSDFEGLKDTFVRSPLWLLKRRPRLLSGGIRINQGQQIASKEREEA